MCYGTEVVNNLSSLLRVTHCDSLDELELGIDSHVAEPFGITVSTWFIGFGFEDNPDCPLTEAELGYPFPVLLVRSVVGEMERENDSWVALLELADRIREIEGIEIYFDQVEIAADQLPISYPYRRPMSGRKTIADWLDDRFDATYPELEACLLIQLPLTTRLSDLRSMSGTTT